MRFLCFFVLSGSAEILFRWGGKINQFFVVTHVQKIIKIGQCLFKLQLKMSGTLFLGHSVVRNAARAGSSHDHRPHAEKMWSFETLHTAHCTVSEKQNQKGLPRFGSLPTYVMQTVDSLLHGTLAAKPKRQKGLTSVEQRTHLRPFAAHVYTRVTGRLINSHSNL